VPPVSSRRRGGSRPERRVGRQRPPFRCPLLRPTPGPQGGAHAPHACHDHPASRRDASDNRRMRRRCPGGPNCSCGLTLRRCRNSCTRGWPTSIARRSGAFAPRWRTRRVAQVPRTPFERSSRRSSRTRWRPAENHTEGRSGRNAERGQRHQEVARYRRPLGPNKAGCGGSQPPLSATVAIGRLKVSSQKSR